MSPSIEEVLGQMAYDLRHIKDYKKRGMVRVTGNQRVVLVNADRLISLQKGVSALRSAELHHGTLSQVIARLIQMNDMNVDPLLTEGIRVLIRELETNLTAA